MPRSDQEARILEVERTVNRRWPGALIRGSDPRLRITRIPTGILSIDYLTGGGFARNRHVELFGGYHVGKTYLVYRFIAWCQANGGQCCFIDVENTFDPVFAESAGVDIEALYMPDREELESANQLVDFMEILVRSRAYDIVALDSIAALLPKDEMDKDMESGSYGTAQAKLMSAALRRLTTANRRSVLVYINQTRDSLGSVFQKRAVTSGGRAMGFYAGTRLELVRVENLKRKSRTIDISKGDERQADIVSGHRVLVRAEKDKTGGTRTHAQSTFVFDYDRGGIDPIEDLIYVGREMGLVHKQGTRWWVDDYEDEASNGRPRFKKWLRRNRVVAQELEESLYELINNRPDPLEEADDEAEEDDDE